MTRIVGGVAGGRRLRTPPGGRTRPTSERVREALFSFLEAELGSLGGLRFLDLYAGSGAVGLEAASRGASAVTLVEHDRRTAALVRDNARTVGVPGVRVACMPVGRFLDAGPDSAYDLVFVDPPYSLERSAVEADLATLAGRGWLADGAVVVAERSARAEPPAWPAGFGPVRVRGYGETSLISATWVGYGRDDLTATRPRDPAEEP